MKKFLNYRILILSLKIAGISVLATFINTLYDGPGHRLLWYFQSKFLLPALYIGAIISGKPHSPNPIVSYAVLFMLYFFITLASIILLKFFYNQILKVFCIKKH